MIRKTYAILLLGALLLSGPIPAGAQDDSQTIDWKKGIWGDLSPHIGTYQYDAVLDAPPVAAALQALMGKDTLADIQQTMTTRAPIGFDDDCLILSQSETNAANSDSALIAVCIYKGTVHAARHKEGRIELYTKAEKYDFIPYAMKMWIYAQSHPDVLSPPDNLDINLTP